MDRYTIYQDRQGGKNIWWTYIDGDTKYLPWSFVSRELMRRRAKLVKTAECS
jgi:hypothetical protein